MEQRVARSPRWKSNGESVQVRRGARPLVEPTTSRRFRLPNSVRWAIRLALLYVFVCFALFVRASYPFGFFSGALVAEPHWEVVSVVTDDGMTIKGWFQGGGDRGLVILAHDFGDSAADAAALARELGTAQFDVLLFDFRAHGVSDGTLSTRGLREAQDVDAILGWARIRYSSLDHVRWVGQGMGASAFLLSQLGKETRGAVLAEPDESIGKVLDQRVSGLMGLPMSPIFDPVLSAAENWLGQRWEKVSALEALRQQGGGRFLFLFTGLDLLTPPPDSLVWTNAAGTESRILIHTGPSAGLLSIARERHLREGVISYLSE